MILVEKCEGGENSPRGDGDSGCCSNFAVHGSLRVSVQYFHLEKYKEYGLQQYRPSAQRGGGSELMLKMSLVLLAREIRSHKSGFEYIETKKKKGM